MRPLVPLSLLALLLVSTAPPSHAQSPGRLTGVVREGPNGPPLPGANVVLVGTPLGASTALDGTFRIDGVAPGTYSVRASLLGYTTRRQTVTVGAGATTPVAFALDVGAIDLAEVTVKGEALRPQGAAATANVVSADDLRRFTGDNPLRLVEEVPGLDLAAFRQGGVADQFSIRGFSGGGHEGEVAVQVDGIPLNEAESHADGYADLNVLIPLELQRLVVYKGPSSALYGNFARGGTLTLDTRKGGTYRDVSLRAGAYETFDAQLALGERFDVGAGRPLETNLAVQLFRTDGYAANSRYLKGTVAGRAAYALTDRTEVNLALRGHSGDWHAPGYIPEDQFRDSARRDEEAVNAQNDGGNKAFYTERLGLGHSFSDDLRLLVFGYATQQDFTRFQKSGFNVGGQSERANNRDVYGAGTSLNGRAAPAGVGVDFVAGAEFYSESTELLRWATSNRVRQNPVQDQDYRLQNAAAFVQVDVAPTPYFRPTLGLRYDAFRGRYANNDPGGAPFTNRIDGLDHLSPKVGVRSTLAGGFDLRASASNGYVLPYGPDKYDAALGLGPVDIWQYEVGASYAAGRFDLDLVGYVLDTSGEIAENPPGSGTFDNFGTTRRRGVEAGATFRPFDGLRATLALGLIETEITENPDAALVGGEVPGIPGRTATVALDYTAPAGFGGRLHVHDVSRYPLTTDGAFTYEGYTTVDLTLFYTLGGRAGTRGRIFAEVGNLLDAAYAEAVFFSRGAPIYAPAPRRNVSVGLAVSL